MRRWLLVLVLLALLLPLGADSARGQAHYRYCHISTQTTTTCKTGGGVLYAISINTVAASGVATVYDNTAGSGTVIAVVTTAAQSTLIYNVIVSTGVTVVTATASPDLTVITD